ncbi:MAG: DnaJ domain-containing protein [Clostridium sp.]|uniref:DnaJ domain-containing protein n=1 Tax=Clostridium sp. TaxID=1506 RepID=UPI0025B87DFF|nr:DnaJ domain-containing protein [Clostridium sp.]MCE5219816.1 DnaJ domain-containing protein [Clostridium sp.]
MTDYYKILGVEKNASKEQIKEAYEKQVEKIKKEVVNEKRLNQFLKIFDQAYEALNSLDENQLIDENATLIMNPQEVQKELEDNDKSNNYINRYNSKSKGRSSGRKKNDFTEKAVSKNKDDKNKLNNNKEEKDRKQKVAEKSSESNTKQIFNLIMLPFKILALPLIAILSVIILLLQIINVISWIATKLLIVGSISVGAIHLYQVKMGQAINYNILILATSVLLASFFLPYILKLMLKVLKIINDALKSFVF